MGSVFVVVIGLIIALLVWAPWGEKTSGTSTAGAGSQTPGQPAAVALTPSESTVSVSWAAPASGPPVERYLILRDGVELAAVDGSTTQYVDSGLIPGETYEYRVTAEANGQRSLPSAFATVTMPAPVPQGLHVTDRATSSLTLAWEPPPGSPQPDSYGIVVSGSGDLVKTVAGTQNDAKVTGLNPATEYAFQVVAIWGTSQSSPSLDASARTRVPSVKSARLAGTLPLRIKVTSTTLGTLKHGLTWTDSWTFKPVCDSGACNTVLKGEITPPGVSTHTFKMTLHRSGAVYTGQNHAQITVCGQPPIVKKVTNTVIVRIRVTSGHLVNGVWRADSWTGTLWLKSPYTTAGLYYCPVQTVTMSLTGR
jgi:hypothetical protein